MSFIDWFKKSDKNQEEEASKNQEPGQKTYQVSDKNRGEETGKNQVKIDENQVEELLSRLETETVVETIKITPEIGTDLTLTSSKFGGLFYLPKNHAIPCTPAGTQLYMLAQINCSELPKNSIYPKNGIIQFWIDSSEDLMGLDFNDGCSDESKRVIYYPTISEHYPENELETIYQPGKDEDGELYTPLMNEPMSLLFSLEHNSIQMDDFRFEPMLVEKWNNLFPTNRIESMWDIREINEQLYDRIYDAFYSEENTRIGGYGNFTQTDPRGENDLESYTELLLQIDSISGENYDIMWGDVGIGNFFATKTQLKNLDFKNCLYNWDCG